MQIDPARGRDSVKSDYSYRGACCWESEVWLAQFGFLKRFSVVLGCILGEPDYYAVDAVLMGEWDFSANRRGRLCCETLLHVRLCVCKTERFGNPSELVVTD